MMTEHDAPFRTAPGICTEPPRTTAPTTLRNALTWFAVLTAGIACGMWAYAATYDAWVMAREAALWADTAALDCTSPLGPDGSAWLDAER